MRENTLKAIWARGDAVVNGWLSIPSAFSAEIMAHQGFDSLTVDMQHGVVDYQTAVTMLQAVSTTSTIPLARVAWNDPALLMKILDAGVLRRDLPDDQHRRAGRGHGESLQIPAAGLPQLGAGARLDLRRGGLRRPRQ